MLTRYKATATPAALSRLYRTMSNEHWNALVMTCALRGESVTDYVGRVAYRGGRMQDVELVAVVTG